jgi:predicted metalloprotease with PDZ domain
MFRNLISSFLAFFYAFCVFSQNAYQITVDLNRVVNDKVKVTVVFPEIASKKVKYIMPAVIPGSYSRKDFGRFISGMEAYASKGNKIKVKKQGNNVFIISNSKKNRLKRLEYWVNDTWDVGKELKLSGDSLNYIFQPGGTNIEEGKNFVLNHQGFYGYVEGYKMLPYKITVLKPSGFFAATSLTVNNVNPEKDILSAPDYVKLVDAPVMYSLPDTTSLLAGNARINIAIYSESKAVSSKQVSDYLKPLSIALSHFFVEMPVNNYHFILYFTDYSHRTDLTRNGGFGALEHSYSSFYFLPELNDTADLKPMILGVVSHEFLHILTPLNIHSEEIENFDFLNPKMSQHLWMYEGVTEYFSNLVQVKEKLMTEENFMKQIQQKIQRAAEYPQVSFTEMSKNILDKKYKSMYNNVYEKGALIGFLLDIRLMELSKGTLSLRDVMMKLKEKYGPAKPFRDDDLINDIVSLSYPQIRQYFNDFVIGSKPLPYKEYFGKIGWDFFESKIDSVNTYGAIEFAFDEKTKTFLISKADKNVFGLQAGDTLIRINDEIISIENYEKTLSDFIDIKPEKLVTVQFKRDKLLTAVGKSYKGTVVVRNLISADPYPTYEKVLLRNKMLNK